MDRDAKGKQGGWSNPNYEVTEGKMGLKIDLGGTTLSLFVCLSVHLFTHFFLQSFVKLSKGCFTFLVSRHISDENMCQPNACIHQQKNIDIL